MKHDDKRSLHPSLALAALLAAPGIGSPRMIT